MEEVALSYDEMLDKVEAQMHEIGCTEFETSGFLVNGLYVRTILIPAGSYLTSLVHKTDHPFILSAGEIIIYTQEGEHHLKAPFVDITPAGTRRFAKAVTDCLWTTIHRTDKQTESEIREETVFESMNPLLKLNDKRNTEIKQ